MILRFDEGHRNYAYMLYTKPLRPLMVEGL